MCSFLVKLRKLDSFFFKTVSLHAKCWMSFATYSSYMGNYLCKYLNFLSYKSHIRRIAINNSMLLI